MAPSGLYAMLCHAFLVFANTLSSVKRSELSVAWAEGNLCAKNQLHPCTRFDTISACDRQTDRHRTTANDSSSIVLRW